MVGYVYLLTNRPNGTLYLGSTENLEQRMLTHKLGKNEGFSKRYGLTQLVYLEEHPTLTDAIRRERAMKKWSRAWKVARILKQNPEWHDLAENLNALIATETGRGTVVPAQAGIHAAPSGGLGGRRAAQPNEETKSL